MLQGDASQLGLAAAGASHGKLEEPDHSSSNWYFSREYIENDSPSRKDGIDLKKETYFRKSYCTYLQDLGMRLKVPQVTIATAIVFCHRFFLRQSHLKNDRHMIATVCMFLAGKVEETPKGLRDVIFYSYEIRNKKDPAAVQRIKQKEVYEQQKELVLLGERLVLTTLGFDLNIHHPYKPLVAAIKKFKVAQNALAQVAWNFVNDGLRTSLCLQFKPHHIAAGAIFLAAKFLKVKLPSEGEKVWWQEFEVTPRQLEEVSNQMLELYEQNREPPASRSSDPSASAGMNTHHRAAGEAPPATAQVQDKSTVVETRSRTVVEDNDQNEYSSHKDQPKASLPGLDEVNIDRLKAAYEKRRKSRGEGGDTRSSVAKTELTDEEELLELDLENGHKDVHYDDKHVHVHNREHHHRHSHVEGGTRSLIKVEPSSEEELLERDLENGRRDSSLDNKYVTAHNRDHSYPHHQYSRKVETDSDHHHHTDRDWQERDYKRPRH